jgi:hypothetical protein
MANLQATLRALVMHLHSLEVLAFSLNEMMYKDTHAGKHLSIFLGLVDTRRNVLQYVNAGMAPPILVRGNSGEVKLLEEGGTVIGLFPQADYARGSAKLEKGDVLACCTDGILQVSDEGKQVYGAKRLAESIRSHRDRNARQIVDAVLSEVSSYSTASMNDDDKVLIVMKVTADKSGEAGSGKQKRLIEVGVSSVDVKPCAAAVRPITHLPNYPITNFFQAPAVFKSSPAPAAPPPLSNSSSSGTSPPWPGEDCPGARACRSA